MMQRRAQLSLAALGLSLLACKDEASVGKDTCQGVNISCVAPERRELPTLFNATRVATDALEELQMAQETTLDIPHDASDGGPLTLAQLVGSRGKLWLFRANRDSPALHVHTLDGSGALTGDQVIDVPEDPEPLQGYSDKGSGPPTFSFMTVINVAPPAPLVEVVWTRACSEPRNQDVSCPVAAELLVFEDSIESPPVRVARRSFGNLQAARGRGQELWTMQSDGLHKSDAHGEVHQNLLNSVDFLNLPEGVSGIAAPASGGLVAVSSSLSDYDQRISELWRFDDSGSATFLAYYERAEASDYNAAVVEDKDGRLIVLSNDHSGDLELVRFARDSLQPETHFVVSRDSYHSLYVESLSQDTAGALYWALTSGSSSRPVNTLCKLPLDGDLRCYAVPELESHQIAAGEADTVYIAVPFYTTHEDGPILSGVRLRRFALP